ncbi:MAG: dihydrofolate reductase [Alistipes sp.]|nr:dihydrofolate reductase [Candidatus Alistipes equi]
MISIIVAVGNNGVIGSSNALLWHISEDLRRFKVLTMGHRIVMGRKTFESIGRPLPGRENVVVSTKITNIDGCRVVQSLDEALEDANQDEIFVIGGAQIYAQTLHLAQRIYLTEVHHTFDGDTYFPSFDRNLFRELSREDFPCGADFPHPFSFVLLERKSI